MLPHFVHKCAIYWYTSTAVHLAVLYNMLTIFVYVFIFYSYICVFAEKLCQIHVYQNTASVSLPHT